MKIRGTEPLVELGTLKPGEVFECEYKVFITTNGEDTGWRQVVNLSTGVIRFMRLSTLICHRPDASVDVFE